MKKNMNTQSNAKENRPQSNFLILLLLSITLFGIVETKAQLSGGWDSFNTSGSNPNVTGHGNGVIQLINRTTTGLSGAAVHETTATYNTTTGGDFSKCYQAFFGCTDDGGDGMAFTFTNKSCNFTVGVGGGNMGYGYAGQCGDQLITIEFDIYPNINDSPGFNPNDGEGPNYQAINSVYSEVAITRNGYVGNNAFVLNAALVPHLDDGLEHSICIDYIRASGTMKVSIDGTEYINYAMGANRLETYFGGGVELSQTWSAGQDGKIVPATISNGAGIIQTIGSPLCPNSITITSFSNGDSIAQCNFPKAISSLTLPPVGKTVQSVQYFVDGTPLGAAVTTSPFTFPNWTPTSGAHLLSAQATYNDATKSLQASAIKVVVTPNPTAGSLSTISDYCVGGTAPTLTLSGHTATGTTWTYERSVNSAAYAPTLTASSNSNVLSSLAAGNYSYRATVTDASGCSATTAVRSFEVKALPSAPTAGNNSPVCVGSQLSLTANTIAGATYAWTGPSSFTSTQEDPTVNSSATAAMAGVYSVRATVAGCTSTAGTTTVTVNSAPSAPTAGNNGPVCVGSQLSLTSNTIAGATYAWTGPSSFTSSVEDPSVNSSATAAMAGTYSVTATLAGCTSTAGTTTVTVNSAPAAPTAGNNGPVCVGSPLNLTANTISGATYAWTGPSSFTSSLEDPSVSATATSTMAGVYSVRATVAGCQSTAGTTTVTVNSVPTATLSGTSTICNQTGVTAPLSISFTGASPYNVNILKDGVPFKTLTGVTGPHTEQVSGNGAYTIANVSDANCSGTSTTGTATIGYKANVVATASLECNDVNAALTASQFQIRVRVTQGDLTTVNITETTAFGVTFTRQGATNEWVSSPINDANTISINVTDGNNCNGGVPVTGLNQQCSCPASGSIALTGVNTICPGTNSTMQVTFATTVGTGPFNIVVSRPVVGDTTITSATSPLSIPIREVGAYSATIQDVGSACTVSATGSVSLAKHTPPTASLTGDASICNQTGVTAPLSILFTGASPYNVNILKDGAPFKTLTGVTSPHSEPVSGNGVYTIASLSDANCTGTSATGTATVSYKADVVATASMECDDVNASLLANQFQIRVTVTQGDLASITISELTSFGVTFTRQGATNEWLSSPISESNTVNINVTDVNNCNGGVSLTGLQQQCSCPSSGSILLTGSDKICPSGSSTMSVTFSRTLGTGAFNVIVTRPLSGDTTINNATSPLSIPIRDLGAYSASVEDVGNSCTVTATGSVSLTSHTLPTASLTGDASICNQTGVTTPLAITFTGASPFSVDILKDNAPFKTLTSVTSPHSELVSGNGTYTVANVSDANCAGTSATGTAVVSYKANVVATATTECDDVNTSLANNQFQIRVKVTQGDLSTVNITETTAFGVTFTRQGATNEWLSSPISESNTVNINVTDGNNCNGGIPLTNLQEQCSCPASGTLTLTGANPICTGASSTMELVFGTTLGTGPFNVFVNHSVSGTTTTTSATSPLSLPISTAGVYTARIEDVGNNCTVSATGSVSLAINTPTSNAGLPKTICKGESTELIGTGTGSGLSYTWTSPNGSLSSTSGATTTASPQTTETYGLTVTDGANCTGTSSVTITVTPSPTITNTVFEETICSGEASKGFVLASDMVGTVFNWTTTKVGVQGSTKTGSGNLLSEVFTNTTNSINGEVIYTVTPSQGNCKGQVEAFTVNVNYLPRVDASADGISEIIAAEGRVVYLNGSFTGSTAVWSSSDSDSEDLLIDPTDSKTEVITDERGVYEYILTASNGSCVASDKVLVRIVPPLEIPNAFSPNGDGTNDSWVIQGIDGYPQAHMSIYNRWGAKLYERFGGYPEATAWDGDNLPVGTYYFILRLNESEGESNDNVARGAITITR